MKKLTASINTELIEEYIDNFIENIKSLESSVCEPSDDLVENCISDYIDVLFIIEPRIILVD